jgi:acetyl-CoA C-acetyltransferase
VVRPEGSVTAGNASGVNDGACALLLASERAAARHGLVPRARVVGMATAGVPPRIMGMGPAPATRKVLELTGLALAQMDVIELNEAFAAQGWRCCAISASPTTTRGSIRTAARSPSAIRSARAAPGW